VCGIFACLFGEEGFIEFEAACTVPYLEGHFHSPVHLIIDDFFLVIAARRIGKGVCSRVNRMGTYFMLVRLSGYVLGKSWDVIILGELS